MKPRDLKIGIIGAGNIASLIQREVPLRYIYDIDDSKAVYFSKRYKCKKVSFEELLKSDAVLIVEAASQQAVRSYATDVLNAGKNLMVLSVGAFSDNGFLHNLLTLAENKGVQIIVPSGAIVGIDGLSAASVCKISEVVLTTTKSPESLGLTDINEPRLIFEGSAKDAVEKFPANINVAATISLAGIGFSKTRVRIIADPDVKENIHELMVRGDFGVFTVITKNLPFPGNPKTSYLAALSAVNTIRKFSSGLKLG